MRRRTASTAAILARDEADEAGSPHFEGGDMDSTTRRLKAIRPGKAWEVQAFGDTVKTCRGR